MIDGECSCFFEELSFTEGESCGGVIECCLFSVLRLVFVGLLWVVPFFGDTLEGRFSLMPIEPGARPLVISFSLASPESSLESGVRLPSNVSVEVERDFPFSAR